MATITGTADPDTIAGTSGNDVLSGGGGADSLDGGDGFDLLEGGAGDDVIDGGEGVDILALGGSKSDYLFEEIAPARNGVPGRYRVTDLREDAPDGVDEFTAIEIIRFRTGGESSLADALDRAPTDLKLGRAPEAGPQVREGASRGTIVATLTGVDPDPGDRFVFTLLDDAGGRFRVEGDKLIVARDDAFDSTANPLHELQVRVTDGAGNIVDKTVSVAVQAGPEAFGAFTANVPDGASVVQLWDQSDGDIVMTWFIVDGAGARRHFARRVDADGDRIDPQAPDVEFALETPGEVANSVLLGVTRNGEAVFKASTVPDGDFFPDFLLWMDATDGDELRQTRINQVRDSESSRSETTTDGRFGPTILRTSSSSFTDETASNYAFNDGFISWSFNRFQGQSASSSVQISEIGGSSASTSSSQSFHEFRADGVGGALFDVNLGSTQRAGAASSFAYFFGGASGGSSSEAGTILAVGAVDFNRDGDFIYAEIVGDFQLSDGFSTENVAITLRGSIGERLVSTGKTRGEFKVVDVEILDATTYAYIIEDFTRGTARKAVFIDDGVETVFVLPDIGTVGGFLITAAGDERYLLQYGDFSDGLFATVAQMFDAGGRPLTTAARLGFGSLLAREDGTAIYYEATTAEAGGQPVTRIGGEGLAPAGVVTTPVGGAYSDEDGDGDFDFSGVLLVGHDGGERQSLRLEGGRYELGAKTLTVTDATVFANIGNDTGSPLFKGSFKVDLASGAASQLVIGTLPAGQDALTLAGLALTYKSLTIGAEGAAFGAAFTLPGVLFEGGPSFSLDSPNALLINASGPELAGFEIEFKDGETGFPTILGNLFKANAKKLVLRYDGANEELAFAGELEVTSDIVDGLASLVGGGGAALKFTDLKIKQGKVDFAGELSAKEWKLPGTDRFSLEKIKLGVVIDDNQLVSVGGAIGLKLPFAQLKGLSFAGNFVLAPSGEERLFLDSLELAAKTNIALPRNFFLDSISGKLTGLGPAAAEPVPAPTLFTGAIGIGWGEEFTFPAIPILEIEEQKDIRLVNGALSATTDFSTFITGTGTVNLISDKIGKHSGAMTWNYDTDVVTLTGAFDYFSGIVTGQASLTLSGAGITSSATATIAIPDRKDFGALRGLSFNGNMLTQLLQDGKADNDFHAVWGTVSLALSQNVTINQVVGFKVDLNTGGLDLILSANDLPKTNSFDVLGGEDYLMIGATWDNAAAGFVATRVRTPEGTFVQEADYAANGIFVVDLYTGATKKTVIIDNPRAGNWDLQIVDPSALGAVAFKGYTPNPPAEVTVGAVTLAAGALTGQASATLTGADAGTIVTFFADTDASGFDGRALGSATVGANGLVAVSFDATLLAGGSYHLYAVAIDPTGAPAMDYGDAPFTVAQRASDISFADASVRDDALPGTVIGAPTATGPDRSETYTFTLADDAGGRFALSDGRLVVGTGAPLDGQSAGSHSVTIRATSSRGLSYDETFTIAVTTGDPARIVRSGSAGPDILLGNGASDVFFDVLPGDTVIGGGAADLLYLNGNRADFRLVLDRTGVLTGEVRAFVRPEGVDPALLPTSLDPPPPYLVITDLRTGSASFLIASGIETIQFRDVRTAAGDVAETPAGPLVGTPRNDIIGGLDAGETYMLQQGGDDRVSGGGGDDGFFFGAAFTSADQVDGGAGSNDQIGLQGNYAGLVLSASMIANVEVIALLAGFDYQISTLESALAPGTLLTIHATALQAGDDFTFDGAAETDGGRFILYGGLGTDTLTGGSGDDGFYFGQDRFSSGDTVNGGAGSNDQLGLDGNYGTAGTPFELGGGNISGIEVVALLQSPGAPQKTYVISANDSLVAAGQTMTIWGVPVQTGIIFDGSAETDGRFIFFGGAGADRFTGGAGGDSLTGGAGADTFAYTTANQSTGVGFDRLIGFDDEGDRIDLPGTVSGFAAPSAGTLSLASFDADLAAGLNAALGPNQAIIFTADAGDMAGRIFGIVDANGDGDYTAGADYVFEFVSPVTPVDQVGLFI